MRNRSTAPLIVVAVTVGSLLLTSGAASAATPGVTFITSADIATPGSFGTTGWSNAGPGTFTDTALNGIVGNANVNPHFGFSSPVELLGGSTLRNVANSTTFHVSDDTDLTPEIRWYSDLAETQEQTLYSLAGGVDALSDATSAWFSTATVGSIGQYSIATLDQFDAQFALDASLAGASVQSVGVYNQGAPLVNFYSFTAGGNVFYFTPEPVSTAPTSIRQDQFGAPGAGATASTTGFVPGETVSAYLATTESLSDPIDLVADADGAVSYTWIAPVPNMDLGGYAISFVGASSGVQQSFDFEVTARSAASTPAALAATGAETTMPLLVGGVLMLGGVALAVAGSMRRKRAS